MGRIHRPHSVSCYLSDEENARFKRAVVGQYHTVASFVRAAVMDAVKRHERENPALEVAGAIEGVETNRS
jgi:hypothetical protein